MHKVLGKNRRGCLIPIRAQVGSGQPTPIRADWVRPARGRGRWGWFTCPASIRGQSGVETGSWRAGSTTSLNTQSSGRGDNLRMTWLREAHVRVSREENYWAAFWRMDMRESKLCWKKASGRGESGNEGFGTWHSEVWVETFANLVVLEERQVWDKMRLERVTKP